MQNRNEDPTAKKRVQRYRIRQAERGMRNVTVYVPDNKVDEIKQIARKMRDKASGNKFDE